MEKILKLIIENNITPNGLFILYCKFNNQLDTLPTTSLNIEISRLQNSGYLDSNFKLTGSSLTILEKCINIYKSDNYVLIDSEFIKSYNSLFPKGRRSGASISYRSNPKELTERFTWFFKTYPEFKKEDVLEATKRYAKAFDDKFDYTYMQCSKYFIKKEDKTKTISSTLADLCYNKEDSEVDSGILFYDSIKENNMG